MNANDKPPRTALPTSGTSYLELALDFISDKGMAVGLLTLIAVAFCYDRVLLQPERDKLLREHEAAIQVAWKATTIEIMDRIDKESERWRIEQSTQNELWRKAVLEAKFGQTDTLRELLKGQGDGGA